MMTNIRWIFPPRRTDADQAGICLETPAFSGELDRKISTTKSLWGGRDCAADDTLHELLALGNSNGPDPTSSRWWQADCRPLGG